MSVLAQLLVLALSVLAHLLVLVLVLVLSPVLSLVLALLLLPQLHCFSPRSELSFCLSFPFPSCSLSSPLLLPACSFRFGSR
jgi:hypothetical protein